MKKLKPGDLVEIIAPASRCTDQNIIELTNLLSTWQLQYKISDDLFGDDLLCANSDEARFDSLKNAFYNPQTKAIICARGGYGCARLISELNKIAPPPDEKLFIGMSDITVLNLYLQQNWHWPVIHGAMSPDKFSRESINSVKSILFGEVDSVQFTGRPLNKVAEKNCVIEAIMTGGNLSILQTSLATFWQVDSNNKILLMEDIGERGYRVDRMLEHLRQAGIFNSVAAIVFGDFTGGLEADGTSLIPSVLERFAQSCPMPVIKIDGVGHDYVNFPMPLGTKAHLQIGSEINLLCTV